MGVTLEEAKKYLRVDGNEEDETIQLLIDFSREEIKNSTGADGTIPSSSYKMAQLLIIANRFEVRTSEEKEIKVNNVLSSLLLKIKMEVMKGDISKSIEE